MIMQDITKPKLVFFQHRFGETLTEFMCMHRQQHIKCLSEFFEVIVIQKDCDYQEVCDKYQPDLTFFEMLTGTEQKNCQKLKVTNIRAYPEIPKLGFHNADSWCEARAGFLSDMEHWGIETIFSISTTAAERTPEIADNLFVWPNFIDADIYRDYQESKIIPVLFTGSKSLLYPWRQKIYNLVSKHYPSLICPHNGYSAGSSPWQVIYGEQYARTINASWIVPSCGTVVKEIVRKHFEIPASKSCLITEKSPSLEAAGFIDMENCVFADEHDVLEKLDYLFQHIDELERITNAGYQLVHSRHTLKQRDQIFQWFNLYKNLKPNENIVQTNPFEPLIVVEKSSSIRSSHIICNGLDIVLLRQGDEKLWAGQYDEAEALYLKSLDMSSMPEVKFKLALCNLYKGNAKTALDWVVQPIQYTLEQYNAFDPDPVEWAYCIISLLCLGKFDEAMKHSNQFPSLSHPELDRTRWVINFLKDGGRIIPLVQNGQSKYRYSIHQLPSLSFNEWIENLCIILNSCQYLALAELLTKYISPEDSSFNKTKNPNDNNNKVLVKKTAAIHLNWFTNLPIISEIAYILNPYPFRNKFIVKLGKRFKLKIRYFAIYLIRNISKV
jgi:tetratricopeptide (TPR) repeat protein